MTLWNCSHPIERRVTETKPDHKGEVRKSEYCGVCGAIDFQPKVRYEEVA